MKTQVKSQTQVHNDSTGLGACLGKDPAHISPTKKVPVPDPDLSMKKKQTIEECKQFYHETKKAKEYVKATVELEKVKEKQTTEEKLKEIQTKEEEAVKGKKAINSKYGEEIKVQVEIEKKQREAEKQNLKKPHEGFIPSGTKQYQEKMEKIKKKKVPEVIEVPKSMNEKQGELVTATMEKEMIMEAQKAKIQTAYKNETTVDKQKVEDSPKKVVELPTDFQTKVIAQKTLEENKNLDSYKKDVDRKNKDEELRKAQEANAHAQKQEEILREKKSKQMQIQREELLASQKKIAEKKKMEKDAKEKEANQIMENIKMEEDHVKSKEQQQKQKMQEITKQYEKTLAVQASAKASKPKEDGVQEVGLNLDSYKKQKLKL